MSDILIRAREPADMADITELLNQPRAIWGTLQMPLVSLDARQKRAVASPAGDLHLVDERVAVRGLEVQAALVGQADNWLNLKRLELNVWSDNSRAMALYERFGFEREGVFRNYAWRDGAYADSVAMARLRP